MLKPDPLILLPSFPAPLNCKPKDKCHDIRISAIQINKTYTRDYLRGVNRISPPVIPSVRFTLSSKAAHLHMTMHKLQIQTTESSKASEQRDKEKFLFNQRTKVWDMHETEE